MNPVGLLVPDRYSPSNFVFYIHSCSVTHFGTVLVRVSIAVKKHHGQGNSYKGKHFIGVGLQFRGSVHYHHGGLQADVVLEKLLRVLHLDLKAAGRDCHTRHRRPQSLSPRNILPPTRPQLLIVPLPMGLWGPFYSTHSKTIVISCRS